ncbi:hypothetical protein P154DRAFT_594863 [Amniculicola lignicola CBS 123094]|uniref:Uncharacterized protein n=1 Tax=Amniculicola lignicola CBS 123094 TaxID=1392246 RepID=A0A6A5WLX8_9PLEO|nr:hypothetical protein P154DRAFT_594863 [Amniculicola lignicola CBS 123094]
MSSSSAEGKLRIEVAIYRPRQGNYHHWGLCVYDTTRKRYTIYEVTGAHPDFEKNVLNSDPRNTRRLVKLIPIDVISRNNQGDLVRAIESVPIDNDTTEWNCQDYVMEILGKLVEECLLDEDDEDYKDSRKELDKLFGPM